MAISQRTRRAALLVTGYFNANLDELEGHARDEATAAALSTAGIEDMSGNFLPRRNPWLRDGRTWIMLRRGLEVRSWTRYILGKDFCLPQNAAVQHEQHNTYHYLVLYGFCGSAPAAHSQ